MENYIEPDKVYVLNKNEVLLAVFDKDDEENSRMIDPEVQLTQNAEAVFTFTINPNNPKWAQINNPENLYLVDGKVYSTNFEGCFNEVLSEDNKNLIQVKAYERQKLLSRKFVKAWNSETGIEIDDFMVVILSNGDLPLKNNGTIVPTTYLKGTSGYVLDALLYGTGWTTGTCDVEGTFDFETEQVDIYENILKVQEMWGGILVFDSVNKTISHRDETTWLPYSGYEVKYQKNMQSLEKLYNNKIITKLCPLGEGSLNIKSVNNNSIWLTNYTYTDTVLEGIENNPDINDPAQLKRWGQRKLQDLCKPRIELTVKAVLLYQVEGYELERVYLNDIVDVINFSNTNNDALQLRVVGFTYKIWDYSDATLELSDITLDSTDIFKKNVQAVNQINDGNVNASKVMDYTNGGQSVKESLKNVNTSLIVESGRIEGIIEEVDGDEGIAARLHTVTETVTELNSKIQEIANIVVSAESQLGSVTLINVNESEPIIVEVHPIGNNISYLYPRSDLYPSDTQYMPNRIIRFKNTTTNEIFDYELPEDLLYHDNDNDSKNYDTFSLDYETQTCQVVKKVGYNSDGSVYVLATPEYHSFTYPTIELTAGNYEVSLPGYSSAYLNVTLMAANYYTTQFATTVTLNSEIRQTVDNINLSVERKLEGYSTKEYTNAQIDIKAGEITSIVEQNYTTQGETAQLSTKIDQTAKSIALTVENGATTAGITITTTKSDGSTDTATGTIQMNGLVTFANLAETSDTTVINGENIKTGTIKAITLQSKNYTANTTGMQINLSGNGSINSKNFKLDTSGNVTVSGTITSSNVTLTGGTIKSANYSSGVSGTLINLSNGVIDSKNFKLDSSGNATVSGSITATSGYIGNSSSGFTIGSSKLFNGKSTLTANTEGVYIGTNGISLGTGSTFKVTPDGTVTATNITATGGKIGGWTITSTQLQAHNGQNYAYINNTSGSNKDFLFVENRNNSSDPSNWTYPVIIRADGYASFTNINLTGNITGSYISGGTISGSSITGAAITGSTISARDTLYAQDISSSFSIYAGGEISTHTYFQCLNYQGATRSELVNIGGTYYKLIGGILCYT